MYHPSNIYSSNQQQHSDPNQPFQVYNNSSENNNNNNKTRQKLYSATIPSLSSSPITNISSELSTAKMKLSVNQGSYDSGNTRSDPLAGTLGGQQLQQQFLQQQSALHQQQQQPTNLPQSSTSSSTSKEMSLPVIQRVDALDVIVHFKKHLQDKQKKNRAKQHVNKIIHYHVQHTFFLRYAAPLFLQDYQELLQTNLAKEGPNQTSSGREQGLLATLKQINTDVLNGSKKTKSIGVLDAYLSKLEEKEQLSEFLEVLVYILFGEAPYQIPSELNERKKNLFHYVSPIIGFLIIFYIHAEKKPLTLDELVTRSGFKQLYKNVEVPGKDLANMDLKNGNDSEDDSEDDQMMEEDDNSIPQAQSQPLNITNNNNNSPSLQSQQQIYPHQQIPEREDINDDKQQQPPRITPQFQDLEKTLLYQQKQQQQQQKQLQRPIIGDANSIQKQMISNGQQASAGQQYKVQQQIEMQGKSSLVSPSFLSQQQQQQHQTQQQQQFVGNKQNTPQGYQSQSQQISGIQTHAKIQAPSRNSQINTSSTPTKSSRIPSNNNSNSNSSTQHYNYQQDIEFNLPQSYQQQAQQQQQQQYTSQKARQDQMSLQNLGNNNNIQHNHIIPQQQQQHGAGNISSQNNAKYFQQIQGNQVISVGVDGSSLQPHRM